MTEKIVIITEKIAVHDSREIRAMAQANGIDIIGGNKVRVGIEAPQEVPVYREEIY